MKEHENTRTGLQRAVDLAYAARAARRILQAAAAGGLHGAAWGLLTGSTAGLVGMGRR